MEQIQNRTVGSFFGAGSEYDNYTLYCSSVILATYLVQKYPDISVLSSMDTNFYNELAQVFLKSGFAITTVWHSQSTGQQTQGRRSA